MRCKATSCILKHIERGQEYYKAVAMGHVRKKMQTPEMDMKCYNKDSVANRRMGCQEAHIPVLRTFTK